MGLPVLDRVAVMPLSKVPEQIRKNAMSEDFSWANSAELYLGLYRELESWNQG